MSATAACAAPKLVFVFCGKRKSGKDYVVSKLQDILTSEVCQVLRLSEPLKAGFAVVMPVRTKEKGLDLARLLDSSAYKEQYRVEMIKWGEDRRMQDAGYFCQRATEGASKPVWVVSDARRPSDMEYFCTQFKCVTVRVTASEEVRKSRGWIFKSGVDDATSECALDTFSCNMVIENNENEEVLMGGLEELRKRAVDAITSTSTSN